MDHVTNMLHGHFVLTTGASANILSQFSSLTPPGPHLDAHVSSLQVSGSGCVDSLATAPEDTAMDQSQINLSNVILVSLVAGTSLFIVNTVILGTHWTVNLR